MMKHITKLSAFVALLLSAAIFGFFYAWVCSTMWGLDRLQANVAIEAMQAMNASVRNATFAPAFFGTGPMLILTAVLSWINRSKDAALVFAAAGFLYITGGMLLTMAVNVPMNEALALVDVQQADAQLTQVWADYSPRWQFWNQIRAAVSGLVVLMTGWGIAMLARNTA